MKFKLEIECVESIRQQGESLNDAVARMLKEVAVSVFNDNARTGCVNDIADAEGTKVGNWAFITTKPKKIYTLYWCSGVREVTEATDVILACGARSHYDTLNFFVEGEDHSYTYNRHTRTWILTITKSV